MAAYDEATNLADAEQLALLLQLLNDFPKPTLGLINGAAYGGALELMACCDGVISADHASFCLSEVRIGLIPAVISPFVINRIGLSWGRHLMTSAPVFNAQQALSYGLVHQVVAFDALTLAKDQWTLMTLNNSSKAITHIKKLLQEFNTQSPLAEKNLASTQIKMTQAIAKSRLSLSGKAGITAFLTKTQALWKE